MIQEANLQWQYVDTESHLVMPWYTLPALEWLKKQDVKEWRVFEYGAGYSTIWWRANADYVNSIDNDKTWATAMSTWWSGGHLTPRKEAYIGSIKGSFDCVVIDGDWRLECLEYSIPYLKPGGFMIIDNWGQDDFPPVAMERAEELLKGWTKVVHKQPNHSRWATAIFQKP
jgi:predicted O-methyltransferase YrrM